MAKKSVRQTPQVRAKAAIKTLYRKAEEIDAGLDVFAEQAQQMAALEKQMGTQAAQLREHGVTVAQLAQVSGMHPQRIHRLIARYGSAGND